MSNHIPILEVNRVTKSFGAVRAADDLSLHLIPGECHALIGPNGAGKTSLIAQVSGVLLPDSGKISFLGQDITSWPIWRRSQVGIARSFQIASIFPEFTVIENVALSLQAHKGHSFHFFKNARYEDQLAASARSILCQLGLEAKENMRAVDLSHGEQRQLELAMTLAGSPSLLLLDEPMAGMGATDSQRMIALLQELRGKVTILLVEHDMNAVFALADRITVMVYGKIIASGSPREIKNNADVRAAYLGQLV